MLKLAIRGYSWAKWTTRGSSAVRIGIIAVLAGALALMAPASAAFARPRQPIKLTTDSAAKQSLSVSDDLVAWQESNHVWIYTQKSGAVDLSGAIGGSGQLDQSPQVSGDRVVWWTQADGRSDIYTWAVGDPVIRRVTTDDLLYSQEPQISGDRIVFQAYQGPGYQVFTWTREGGVEQVSTNSNSNWLRTKVSGDRIAYVIRDAQQHWSLYTWVAGGSGPVRIASDVSWEFLNLTDMADGRVAGVGWAVGSTSAEVITWASGDTTLTRVGAPTAQLQEPHISGGRIVWQSAAGEVYTWSATDPIVSLVTDDAVFGAGSSGVSPDISGDHVAWAKSLAQVDDPSDPMYPHGYETKLIGAGPVLWTPGATTLMDIPYQGQLASAVQVAPSLVAFLGWEGDPFNGGVQQVYAYETGEPITATAGTHGSITPTGTAWVLPGSDAIYTVTPDAGYRVASVTVDGDPVSLVDGQYVFSEVSEEHTIAVTFTLAPDPAFSYGAKQFAKFAASDGAAGDNFGWSVAVSGDTAIAGAWGDDGGKGSAYIYTRSGDTWTQRAKVTASDGAAGDHFGWAVAISGDTAVVGAIDDADRGMSTGAAYVFTGSGGTWTQQAKLTADDGASGDIFGFSVAISGDTAVVGARNADRAGYWSGSAWVFTRTGTSWTQQAELASANQAANDWFGFSVAVEGDTALIGACTDGDNGAYSGSAFVFTRSGTTWTQEATLTASDGASGDYFGSSVAISGDTAIIGATNDDDSGSNSGSAFVFTRSGATWTQQAKLLASDGASNDGLGDSVALSGDTAVIGARGDADNGLNSGSAFVFNRSGTTWTQNAKLLASDGAASDSFGTSVAISGDTAMVGAYYAANNGIRSGAVYFFEPATPTLTLSYAAGADGSIVGSATQAVASGSSGTTVTALPNEGHHFVKWSDNVMTAARRDPNVVASLTTTATFAIDTFTVTTTCGPHGSISPVGPLTMDWHASQRFDFTPDEGYHVENVISDRMSYGASPWLSYGQTESDHDLSVTFAISSYALKYVAGNGGTLSGTASQTVEYGSLGTTVTAVPTGDYHFVGWSDGHPDAERRDVAGSSDATYTAQFALNAICRDDAATAYSRPVWVTPLANDDAGVGAIESFGQPGHGTVARPDGAPAGSLLYTPAADFLGQDSFTYATASGQAATVTVTVEPNVSAPRNVEAAKATTRSVTVTWDVPTSLGSGFAAYEVKWRSHGTGAWNLMDPITVPSTRSLTVVGLVPGVTYDFAVTARDTGDYTAASDAASLLLVGDAPVPVAPPVSGAVGSTATVSISGVSDGASLTVDPDAADQIPGVGRVFIDGLRVTIVPDPGFSGLIDLPVTVLQDGTETVVHILLTVRPGDPYSVTFGPASSHSTRVQWAGSTGATGYRIRVGATVVGTTGLGASSFTYGKLLGPNAGVTVQALGAGGTESAQVRAAYRSSSAVKIGTVTFKANSSGLTAAGRLSLRKLAALVKAQGFKTLTINGVTGKETHGSAVFRKRLATARAKAVRTYLLGRFKAAHYSVKITILTSSGKAIASKYRIAEIAIR